ncbi:DUF2490 domain-containing protein [Dyadobacter frigoris]|uniref:DUF2490 domain-containing protein n=1 Tax=Dyadobacter frigoris TaxID=2576211 RepID=UPI0025542B1C|nr:DUF2490 domain-containing protein [Dyadobacter frigoris]
MKRRKLCYSLLKCLFLLSFQQTSAQTIEHNGWLFWSHQQKISERWQFSADVQVRSADKLNYLNTLLIRPGIGYKIADNQTITVGYTYFGTWDKENQHKVYEPENRIFEQFQIENEIQRTEITNRFRYEQRFLNLQNSKAFAQRFRYYVQAQIPLFTNPLFTKGLYLSVQNELFLNAQGKDQVNNHFFDQNRSYAGPGYRFSESLDLEIGYMFRYQIEKEANMRNNILQVVIKTSF